VQSVPIIALMGDPIAWGIVSNLARRAGNITGISADADEAIWSRRVGMLIEAIPTATRIGFLCSQARGRAQSCQSIFGYLLASALRDLYKSIIASLTNFNARPFTRCLSAMAQINLSTERRTDLLGQ
jgi:ABC-type uncharacterized transport system substrate-binding protein